MFKELPVGATDTTGDLGITKSREFTHVTVGDRTETKLPIAQFLFYFQHNNRKQLEHFQIRLSRNLEIWQLYWKVMKTGKKVTICLFTL